MFDNTVKNTYWYACNMHTRRAMTYVAFVQIENAIVDSSHERVRKRPHETSSFLVHCPAPGRRIQSEAAWVGSRSGSAASRCACPRRL